MHGIYYYNSPIKIHGIPFFNKAVQFERLPEHLREKYVFDDAGHALSYATAGVLYEKKISDFIKSRTVL